MQSDATDSHLTTADQSKLAYTIKEASRAAASSRSSLYAAIASGRLRARKFGSRTIILAEELRRFLRTLPRLDPSPFETATAPKPQQHPRGRRSKQPQTARSP
jgi:excisionase family DNA binding protein